MIQDILCKINDLLDNEDKKEIQQLKQNGINLNDNILSYEVDCNNEEYTKTAINHALLDYNDVRFNHTVNIESEEQNKHSYCVCIKNCDDNSPYALQIRERYNKEISTLRNEVFLDLQDELSKCYITEKLIDEKCAYVSMARDDIKIKFQLETGFVGRVCIYTRQLEKYGYLRPTEDYIKKQCSNDNNYLYKALKTGGKDLGLIGSINYAEILDEAKSYGVMPFLYYNCMLKNTDKQYCASYAKGLEKFTEIKCQALKQINNNENTPINNHNVQIIESLLHEESFRKAIYDKHSDEIIQSLAMNSINFTSKQVKKIVQNYQLFSDNSENTIDKLEKAADCIEFGICN